MPLLRVKDKLSGVKVLSAGQWQQAFPFAKAAGINPAFDLLSHGYRNGSVLTGSLYRYFEKENPDLLNMLHRLTTTVDCSLEQENAKTLFGENVCVSPSGVEVYHKCRFYYFCRYGLRINPRQKVALDVLSRGTLVHYVLEQMFLSHGSRGLSTLSPDMLKSNVHSLLMDYVETTMGGMAEKPHTFLYQLERIETLLVSLLHHMAQELKDSGFETAACELKIGFDGQVPPLTVALPDGGTLSVMGVVDRLDVYEKDGITYFRVVDYKTGTKDFRLDDIYYGIGLQMLLYMYAVEKNGIAFGQHRQSAGVLYMPARRVSVRKEGDTEKQLAKTLQMKGLVLDDPVVIEAMDPHRSGLYMPFSFKKDGTLGISKSLASLEFFGKTRKEIEHLLYEMGKSLAIGDITCDPLDPSGTGEDACGYCDYKAVCPNHGDKPHRKIPTLSAAMEKELLKGGDFHELQANAQTGTGD
jgi:ATP-dependent helicase/nuclease subunit B